MTALGPTWEPSDDPAPAQGSKGARQAEAIAMVDRDRQLRKAISDGAELILNEGDLPAQIRLFQAFALARGIDPLPTEAETSALLAELDADDGYLGDPLRRVSRRLRLADGDRTLERVRKHGGRGGLYDLVLRDGTIIELGTARDVLDPRRVQAAVADATTIVIPETRRPLWAHVAQGIFKLAVVADNDESPEDITRRWVDEYARSAARVYLDDPQGRLDAIQSHAHGGAFRDEHGHVWLHSDRFSVWLKRELTIAIGPQEIGARLRRAGLERKQLSQRDDTGSVRKRTLWRTVDPQPRPAVPRSLYAHRNPLPNIAGQSGQRDIPTNTGDPEADALGTTAGQVGTEARDAA
ncbi:MAG: hypothetical protein JWQ48_534 [Conexibacter sp.]|nr:hypothetical protein [Conexibacter sp.]